MAEASRQGLKRIYMVTPDFVSVCVEMAEASRQGLKLYSTLPSLLKEGSKWLKPPVRGSQVIRL